LGYAIRTLREEFPDLFYKELSFDIYRFGFWFICFMILHNHMLCFFSIEW
jgi:hypothetical protein